VYFYEGGVVMATSSIFANVRIDDPKMAEAFTDAYIDYMEHPKPRKYSERKSLITNPEEIRRLLSKGEKN
jgi:hypothetical protein